MKLSVYIQTWSFYNPDRVLFIKNEETRFYAIEAKDRKKESKRIESLIRLAKEDYDILVLSVETLMRKYLPKRLYVESKLDLEIGSIWNLAELVDLLVHYGYEREARVEGPGQISLHWRDSGYIPANLLSFLIDWNFLTMKLILYEPLIR